MKKFLLSTVALAGLTAGAVAADLPSRRAPAPYVAVPVFTWTGFYAGVNAGYGFSDNNNRNGGVFLPAGTFAAPNAAVSGTVFTNGGNRSQEGFTGGGQVGYNYQIGNFVVGIEADAQYLDFNNRRTNTSTFVTTGGVAIPAAFVPGTSVNSGLDFFGTVRGRVGYAFDRALVYGTGGFAYGSGDTRNQTFGTRNDDFRTGFAAGGGVEYAFTPSLIGRVEGLYVSMDRQRDNGFVGTIGGTPVFVANNRRFDNEFAVVRAGLSYKFNAY